MFCSQCGASLPDQATFCPKCGNPRAAGEALPSAKTFGLSAFSKIVALVEAAVVVLGLVLLKVSSPELGKSISNLLLAVQGSLATLCLVGGGVAGIVCFVLAANNTGQAKTRYVRIASLLLFGPVVWWVCIILAYIIFNVAQQLLFAR